MPLNARLTRLEQKQAPADPYEGMSIDEIAASLEAMDREIEASAGMPVSDYAGMLESQTAAGTIAGMDETVARRFIESVRTPNLEIARELHRENSTYPRFLRSTLSKAASW